MPSTETEREETFEANWPAANYIDKTEEILHEASTYAELAVVTLKEIMRRYDSGERPDPLPDLASVGQLAVLQLLIEDHAGRLNTVAHDLARLVRGLDVIRRVELADEADREADRAEAEKRPDWP